LLPVDPPPSSGLTKVATAVQDPLVLFVLTGRPMMIMRMMLLLLLLLLLF
jgi:hypothetical protein